MFYLAAYLHQLDPFAIEFSRGFGIRWYGLSYLVGFAIGYLLIRRMVRVGVSTLKPEQVGDMIVAGAVGIVLGGRLGYALFYDRALFYTFSESMPWWNLLALQRGGMASHGGIIGYLIAMLVFAKRRGHSAAHLLDLGAFACALGLGIGRVANFVNGELYGRPCAGDFALAVKFPREIFEWPLSKIEFIAPMLEALPPSRQLPLREHVVHAVQAGNVRVIEALTPLLTPRHPSQLYEAVLEGLVVFLVLGWIWRRPRKPLVIGGWFMVTYGVVRIIVEFFREPDEGIDMWFDLSRGQWLSFPLVIAGIVMVWIASRRDVPVMGGWMARQERQQQQASSE